jgi:hypothetical protein
MLHPVVVLSLLPILVIACTAVRRSPLALRTLAALAMLLPFFVPLQFPLIRAFVALFTLMVLVKALQYSAGEERPADWRDVLRFFVMPVVVRWDAPRRPDRAGALRALAIVLGQVALVAGVQWAVHAYLAPRSAWQLVTTELCIYLSVAAALNGLASLLTWRGIDHDQPFQAPLLSRTPAEFWGRRWNSWVNHLLYRHVFLPFGGRRHPVRGTLAAFAASAAFHEYLFDVTTLRFSGWMALYFLVQGVLVVATATPWVRRFARRVPHLAWALTLGVMVATGVLFVRGAQGVDPTDAWQRCCEPAAG